MALYRMLTVCMLPAWRRPGPASFVTLSIEIMASPARALLVIIKANAKKNDSFLMLSLLKNLSGSKSEIRYLTFFSLQLGGSNTLLINVPLR
jgi:hypothetical protein